MGFLETVKQGRLVTDPDVLRALESVPRAPHHPPEYAPLAADDLPVPTSPRNLTNRPSPSPTVHGLLLQLLELEPGLRVAVVDGDPWARALANALASSDVAGEEVLAGSGVPRPFQRVLCLADDVAKPERLKGILGDGGFALFPRRGARGPEIVKILRGGTEFLEMRITSLGLPGVGAPEGGGMEGGVARALALDRLMQNAFTGARETPHDAHFFETVEDTYEAPEAVRERLGADDYRRWEIARQAFHCAYVRQSVGDLDAAIDAYTASLQVRRTAEAHTFLGWTYSFQGRLADAIEECHRAIEADPTFGNPYNDIGAYLLEEGKVDEAIPWFEKAKVSERYCCYFYAYSNLGRAYLLKGMQAKARREFEQALKINPEYELAREMLRRLDRGVDYFG